MKPAAFAELAQRRDIASRSASESEVCTDHDVDRSQLADQHRLDELFRRVAARTLGEVDDVDAVEPELAEQLEATVKRRQQRRLFVRPQHVLGQRVERDRRLAGSRSSAARASAR